MEINHILFLTENQVRELLDGFVKREEDEVVQSETAIECYEDVELAIV